MACVDCNCGRREREEEMGVIEPGCGPIPEIKSEQESEDGFRVIRPEIDFEVTAENRELILKVLLNILKMTDSMIDTGHAPFDMKTVSILGVYNRIFSYIEEDIMRNLANEKVFNKIEQENLALKDAAKVYKNKYEEGLAEIQKLNSKLTALETAVKLKSLDDMISTNDVNPEAWQEYDIHGIPITKEMKDICYTGLSSGAYEKNPKSKKKKKK